MSELGTGGEVKEEATAGVAAPAPAPGVGGAAGDWFASLPPELQGEKSLEGFKGKGVADVAKSYVEAQKLVGGSIRLPGEKATPEEKATALKGVYAKLGVPEKPEGYTFELPQDLPPQLEWADTKVTEFKTLAHSLNLSNEQMAGILPMFVKEVSAFVPDHQKDATEMRKELVEAYGEPMYRRMIGNGYRAAKHYGGQALIDYLDASGAGNKRVLIEAFAKAGRDLAEHGVVDGAELASTGVATAEEAKAKIASVLADKTHPYHSKDAVGHDEAVQEMLQYHMLGYQGA